MFRLSVICALSIAWLSHSADAALREYTFTLRQLLGTNGTGTGSLSPDCTNIWKQKRWLYLVGNGTGTQSATLPGPTIEADEGDRIRVTVVNENEVMAATIHWHGIHQKGTVYSDGASAVTQCSLGPFQSQTYEFNAYPAGTHYYHSHQGLTASDGLAGAIIVRPIDQEPFQYDEEREVVLMDYFSSTSLQKGSGLQSPQFKWIGSPDSLLLNGKGLSNTCKDFDGDQPWTKCIKKCSKNAEGNIEESCIAKCDQPGMPVCSDSCSDTSKWTERIRVEKGKIVSNTIPTQNVSLLQDRVHLIVFPLHTVPIPYHQRWRIDLPKLRHQQSHHDSCRSRWTLYRTYRSLELDNRTGAAIFCFGNGRSRRRQLLDAIDVHWSQPDGQPYRKFRSQLR